MVKLKSIDLFAGNGGIRLGFDRAFGNGIKTVFVSEWMNTLKKHIKLISMTTLKLLVILRK